MCRYKSLGEPFYIQKLSGKPFIRLNKISTTLYRARRKTPMNIEKWPGTRAFSVKFKIERAHEAKHNKAQTYFGVAFTTYLLKILYQRIGRKFFNHLLVILVTILETQVFVNCAVFFRMTLLRYTQYNTCIICILIAAQASAVAQLLSHSVSCSKGCSTLKPNSAHRKHVYVYGFSEGLSIHAVR